LDLRKRKVTDDWKKIHSEELHIFTLHHLRVSRGSSVSIVSDYGLDYRGSIPDRGRGFFLSPLRPDRLWAHPASYPMDTGGKARPGRDADHSPSSGVEVKYE
jgi:hypothetical protein